MFSIHYHLNKKIVKGYLESEASFSLFVTSHIRPILMSSLLRLQRRLQKLKEMARKKLLKYAYSLPLSLKPHTLSLSTALNSRNPSKNLHFPGLA